MEFPEPWFDPTNPMYHHHRWIRMRARMWIATMDVAGPDFPWTVWIT